MNGVHAAASWWFVGLQLFAMTKEDMGFRRFMLRSSVKVEVECMLLSLAYNLLKLHHKTRKQRLGTGLVVPAAFPAGL